MEGSGTTDSSGLGQHGVRTRLSVCLAVAWFLLLIGWYFRGYLGSLETLLDPLLSHIPFLRSVIESGKP